MDNIFYSKEFQSGEVYFSESLSRAIVTGEIEVTATEDLILPAAYPFINNVPAIFSNVNTATGFLVEELCLWEGQTAKFAVFTSGLGISVNVDLLPVIDVNEDYFDETYRSRMTELNFVLKTYELLLGSR
jgi:hypothetical protein